MSNARCAKPKLYNTTFQLVFFARLYPAIPAGQHPPCREAFSDREDSMAPDVHPDRSAQSILHQTCTVDLPQWVFTLLGRLFVLPQAWDGWAAIHEKPHQVFICSMSATFSSLVINSWALGVVSKRLGLAQFIPCMIYCANHLATNLAVWRHGPMICKTKLCFVSSSLFAISHIYVAIRVVSAPIELIFLGNRLLFIMTITVGLWAAHVSAVLGLWAMDHPAEPYRCTYPLQNVDGDKNQLSVRSDAITGCRDHFLFASSHSSCIHT